MRSLLLFVFAAVGYAQNGGTISGTVALTPQSLSFTLGSVSFSATNVMLSQTGVSVDSLSLTLPASLVPQGSNGTLTATNVFLNADDGPAPK